MPEQVYPVDDVFGVSRDVPLNYVDRVDVDGRLIDSLSRTHHIVIYGSSKQGKTCLRKRCLDADDYITVSCQNKWKLSDLHSAILKQAGYEVRLSTAQAVGGHQKISATVGGKFKAWLLGEIEATGSGELERHTVEEITTSGLELDPNDANDIIRALNGIGFKKYVAIEDFHYLPDETQRDFSFALKTFHEASKLSFIITGVWREQNRLITFNGDLTERVFSVDVDNWTREHLSQVISIGGNLMNVTFNRHFIEALLNGCSGSVHLVQEACRRLCRENGVLATSDTLVEIGSAEDASRLLKEIVDGQSARYRGFLLNFADGFQQTDLEMPKWLIFVILSVEPEKLESGIRMREISQRIKSAHPRGDGLNNGNIFQALNSATSLQANKGVRPIVLDYDTTNRNLHVVDKGFLIWLEHQDKGELLEELGLDNSQISSDGS